MTDDLPSLTAAQAAARLGIKPESLYAYVSRGLLRRHKGPGGSRFDALEVEAFARSRRSAGRTVAPPAGHSPGSPLMIIEHDITLLEDDRLYFRGRDAVELADSGAGSRGSGESFGAGSGGYETICHWLWTRTWVPGTRFHAAAAGRAATAVLAAGLPPGLSLRDQLQLQVTVLGSTDPLRHDLSTASVARMGAEIIAGLVAALPARGPEPDEDGPLAARLWPRLTDRPADDATLGLLDAALVMLVDHDLAASTLAVRAAASARAHPYAAVSCGLAALDSALHGNAGRAAYAMVADVLAGEPAEQAIGAAVVRHGHVPGFGHRIYRRADPRWTYLIERLATAVPDSPAVAAANRITDAVAHRIAGFPNVDLALATIAHALALEPGATEVIFALGRTGGWIAHTIAEYAEAPLRLRPEGRYTGP